MHQIIPIVFLKDCLFLQKEKQKYILYISVTVRTNTMQSCSYISNLLHLQ